MNNEQEFTEFSDRLRRFKPFPSDLFSHVILEEDAGIKFAQAVEKAYNTKNDITILLKVKCDLEPLDFFLWVAVYDAYLKEFFKVEKIDVLHRDVIADITCYSVDPSRLISPVSFSYYKENENICLKLKFAGSDKEDWKVYRNLVFGRKFAAEIRDYVGDAKGKDLAEAVFRWLKEKTNFQDRIETSEEIRTNGNSVNIADLYSHPGREECEVFSAAYFGCTTIAGLLGKKEVYVYNIDPVLRQTCMTNSLKIDSETYYVSTFKTDYKKILWTRKELEGIFRQDLYDQEQQRLAALY